MDPNVAICPRCGLRLHRGAPEGLCPVCLFTAAGTVNPELEGHEEPGRVDLPEVAHQSAARRIGNYELLEQIGRGGMGVVFRARQRGLNRIVALKMVLAGRISGPAAIARFRAEAELAAQLQHPNIVAIHEVGEQEGEPFFSMDYIDGRNLAELVQDHPLPTRTAATYVQAIAAAIHYAHQQGVLHRDLKPSNILIDAFDQPRITDFGLAKRLSADAELTSTGQMAGSPSYAAPEQVMGWRHRIGPASDVYSLGAVLYHLLTRQPPFIADSLGALARLVQEAEPVPVRRLNPHVPVDLETICLKCLDKDPGRRYASAAALADDLARFLRSEPILARPPGVWGRLGRWCRRKPALAATLAGLAGIAILSAVAVLDAWHQAERMAASERVQRQLAEQHLLVADTQLAYQAWNLDKPDAARSLLAGHAHQTRYHDFAWRYLWNRCQGDSLVLPSGHSNVITQIAISRDNRWLASCDRSQTLTLWDLKHRRPLWSLNGYIALGGFVAEGDALLASAQHGAVSLLELAAGRVRRTLLAEGLLLGLVNGGRAFTTAGTNFHLKLWDIDTGRPLASIPGSQSYLGYTDAVARRIRVTPNGATLGVISFGRTNNVAIWDVARGVKQCVATVPRPLALDLSPDGQTWIACSLNGEIYQGTTFTNLFRALSTLARPPTALAFTPDGAEFITGHDHAIVRRWNAGSGQLVESMWGQTGGTSTIAFSPDGELIATGSTDGTLQLWARNRAPAVRIIEGWRPGWQDLSDQVALTPDELTLAIAHSGQTIKLLSLNGLRELLTLPDPGFPVSFCDQGRRLLTVSGPTLRLWDLANTSVVRQVTCPARAGSARIVLLSPDEQSVLFIGAFKNEADDELVLCAAVDGRELVHAQAAYTRLKRVAFWQDQQQVAGIGQGDNVYWWSTAEGRLVRTQDADPPSAPKGEVTAIRKARVEQGVVLPTPPGSPFPGALVQSRDGSFWLTGGKDGSVKLWRTSDSQLHLTLLSHQCAVTDAAFSSDGRSFATADLTETIKLWNLDLGRETGALIQSTYPLGDTNSGIKRLLFAAHGDVLLALNRRGQLKAWSVQRATIP